MFGVQDLYDPKLTPATLTAFLDEGWIPAPHLMLISAKVAAAIKKGNARLIVSVPPRHGKSRMLSIGSTIWTVEKFPKYNVGICTYAATLSTDFSQAVRDQIGLNEDKLDVRIRQGSNRVDRFLTTGGGGVYAFGIGGTVIGRGFHVFFLDDYIKDLKEALSPTFRQATWDWYVTTTTTRLEPGASLIIIATRWHDDDLIGRIIKQDEGVGDWEYIRIPAIAEKNDPVGRAPGEALFPERYDIAALNRIKRVMGSHYFSAIYQQNPQDDASKLARKEWLRKLGAAEMPHPNTLVWGRFWDLASLQEAGDYTAGGLIGANKARGTLYIKHMVREQLSPNGVNELVKSTAEADGRHVPIYIEQEPGSSGAHTVNSFKNLLPDYNVIGVPVIKNKVVKGAGVLAAAERGDVFIQYGDWNAEFEDEWDAFPSGDYDDQFDVASTAFNELIGELDVSATWGRETTTGADAAVRGGVTGQQLVTGATWGRTKGGLVVPGRYSNAGVGTHRIRSH